MAKFAGPTAPKRTFDPTKAIVRVEGDIVGVPNLELSEDGEAAFAVIPLEDVTIERASGDQEHFQRRDQKVLYTRRFNFDEKGNRFSDILDEDKEIRDPATLYENPTGQEPWYDVFLPAFSEVGYNFNDPEQTTEAIGRHLTLTRQTVERRIADAGGRTEDPYTESEIAREEDGSFKRINNKRVFLTEDGTEIQRVDGKWVLAGTDEVVDTEPRRVAMEYTGLLPESLS